MRSRSTRPVSRSCGAVSVTSACDPEDRGAPLAGHGGTGRSGSCGRPGFVCPTAGGDDCVADVRLDLDPGVGNPVAQAALDPLPQVIAQPGVARQARQPGLSGALDHRRVPAQLAAAR